MSKVTGLKESDIERELKAAGAVFLRCQGSHHLWKLPSGAVVSFSVKGTHSDIAPKDVSRVRRAIKGKLSIPLKGKP